MIEKAKQGDAKAIYTIGVIYSGREEQKKAILWLGTSSTLGYHESQIILGDLFLKTDSKTSFRWYKIAKDNGLKQSLSRLGDYYVQKCEYNSAVEQYLEAANHGDPYSQNCLGELYTRGIIGQNVPSALKWFLAAAKQNYTKAQFNVANAYELGQGVALGWYKAIYWYEQSKMGGYEPAFH
jgi:TPR repeat protein